MSVAKSVKKQILSMYSLGEPFSARVFSALGSRRAVDCAIARLAKEGALERVSHGVYMRPKTSRFTSSVAPEIDKVVTAIASKTNEKIGISGAEAAQRLKLTTQVPMVKMYYTSGATREVKIGNQHIKLKHVANRKLAKAGQPAGMVLSALWYLGEKGMSHATLDKVASVLSPSVLSEVERLNIPAWMADSLRAYNQDKAVA